MRKVVVTRPMRMTMAVTRGLILKIENCKLLEQPRILYFILYNFFIARTAFAKAINRVYIDTTFTIAFLQDVVSSIIYFTRS